jgi:hypothetical protein
VNVGLNVSWQLPTMALEEKSNFPNLLDNYERETKTTAETARLNAA